MTSRIAVRVFRKRQASKLAATDVLLKYPSEWHFRASFLLGMLFEIIAAYFCYTTAKTKNEAESN